MAQIGIPIAIDFWIVGHRDLEQDPLRFGPCMSLWRWKRRGRYWTVRQLLVLSDRPPVLKMNRSNISEISYSSPTGRSPCPGNKACLHVWFLRHRLDSRFHWQPCDQDSGQGHSRSLRVVERSTSCLPACRPATLLRFFTAACAPPFGTPAPRSPFPVIGHGLGPDPTRHAPSSEKRHQPALVSISILVNCQRFVHGKKTEFSWSMTKRPLSCRKWRSPSQSGPFGETQCRGQSVIVQVFAAGFASPSSCPNTTELMATGQR